MSETQTTDTTIDDGPEPAGFGNSAPAPEPQATEQQRDKFVPHAALHEEREKRKKLEAEIAAEREKTSRMDERLRILQEAWSQPRAPAEAPKPAAVPTLDEDARGFVEHLANEVSTLKQGTVEQRQAVEREARVQELFGWAANQENAYKSSTPDYDAASQHLLNHRAAEYRALGIPEQQIPHMIRQDMMTVAAQARQNGTNVAETIYKLAAHRGYQKAAAAPVATDEARAETIARGQELAAGTPVSGGPTRSVDADALYNMSETEFLAFVADHPKQYERIRDR